MTTYPPTTARKLATWLDNDPIAASHIKEYLSNDRLIELLEIKLPEPPEPDEPDIMDFKDREIVAEVEERELYSDVLEDAPLADIIAELKDRGTSIDTIKDLLSR